MSNTSIPKNLQVQTCLQSIKKLFYLFKNSTENSPEPPVRDVGDDSVMTRAYTQVMQEEKIFQIIPKPLTPTE